MEITRAETSITGAEGAAHQPSTAAEAAEEEKKKMKVLVAMDESDGSFYALKWALDHLFCYPFQPDQEPNAITLVHVQPLSQLFIYPAGPDAPYATPEVLDAVKQAKAQNAANILSRALHMCKEKKIKAESLILEGDPKDRILQAAEELHVDLVVVGSRGLGTIKRALLGSVSNYCVHHAHCPILIVKPPSKEAHE